MTWKLIWLAARAAISFPLKKSVSCLSSVLTFVFILFSCLHSCFILLFFQFLSKGMRHCDLLDVVVTLFTRGNGLRLAYPNTLQTPFTVLIINPSQEYGLFPCLCDPLLPNKTIIRAGIVTFTAVCAGLKVQYRDKPCAGGTQVLLLGGAGAHNNPAHGLIQIAKPGGVSDKGLVWISLLRWKVFYLYLMITAVKCLQVSRHTLGVFSAKDIFNGPFQRIRVQKPTRLADRPQHRYIGPAVLCHGNPHGIEAS